MPASLDGDTIRHGLKHLGERLRVDHEVELTIVGAAAAVLTGELPAHWQTADVDVLPPNEMEELLDAAADAQKALRLPPAWLNDFAGLWYHDLPEGWEQRRVLVGIFGPLKVLAIGRLDQIAMKFLAHRTGDLEHLALMRVSQLELRFVRQHLQSLARHLPDEAPRIDMALSVLNGWLT